MLVMETENATNPSLCKPLARNSSKQWEEEHKKEKETVNHNDSRSRRTDSNRGKRQINRKIFVFISA